METGLDVSVDCVVFGFDDNELKVLLIEQRPQLTVTNTQKALPGDLVKENEDLDGAANRVLKELTKLTGLYLHQFKAFGDPKRVSDLKDQEWLRAFRSRPQSRVITVAYYSLVRMEDYEPMASSFAGKVEWLKLDEVPELAFDHNKILNEAIKVLKAEVNLKLLSKLLPNKFSLSQVQRLYELILGKELDKRNFRKKLKNENQLIELDEKEEHVDHKPAQLYSYKLE